MRKSEFRIRPRVESVEARRLPAGVVAALTSHAYDATAEGVVRVAERLASTQNTVQAEAAVAGLAAKIPGGTQQLLPAWQNDLGAYNAGVRGSAAAVARSLLTDLREDVVNGVALGQIRVTGANAPVFRRLASASSPGGGATEPVVAADYVNIQNSTGFNITAQVVLGNNPTPSSPTITQTLTNPTPQPFDFGTSTGQYMTLTVSNANGSQTPIPYTTQLGMPIGGYIGMVFTVTASGNYFSVAM